MRIINQLFTSTVFTLLFCFVAPTYTMSLDSGADNERKDGEKEEWLADSVKNPQLNKLLLETLTNNQCDIARTLLTHKADPNHHIPPQPFSTGPGKTILMEMAEKETPEAVACLLDAKADPKVRSWGTAIPMNAFEWSMHNDQHFVALTQLFIAREAGPTGLGPILYDLQFPYGWERKTPLFIQAMNINNRSPLIALFLDNHANPFTRDLNSDHNALDTVCLRTHTPPNTPPYYTKECPFKLALLLYTYGLTPNTQKLKKYFSPQQIACMKKERARRVADIEYITTLYSVEQQVRQPFKVSYNNALLHTLLQTFSHAPEVLVNIIAGYAEYHPELANYARDSDPENYDPALKVPAKEKKELKKQCVIQ